MNNDERLIRDLVAKWHDATAAGDVDSVLALMSEDVVFLVAGQPPLHGRQAFAESLHGLLRTHRIESTSNVKDILASGELAYCWSYLTVTVTPLHGGIPVTRAGNALSILRKQPNGSWAIARDANLLSIVTTPSA
jgi:uncharacterized protein (TIGR02246 family)